MPIVEIEGLNGTWKSSGATSGLGWANDCCNSSMRVVWILTGQRRCTSYTIRCDMRSLMIFMIYTDTHVRRFFYKIRTESYKNLSFLVKQGLIEFSSFEIAIGLRRSYLLLDNALNAIR